jgi:hypothetical protein
MCDLYRSPSIARTMKCGRLRWAGHLAAKGETNAYNILAGKSLVKHSLVTYHFYIHSMKFEVVAVV